MPNNNEWILACAVALIIGAVPADLFAVDWDGKNWALGCDFSTPDIRQLEMPLSGAKCGPACEATPECTHFTWTGGVCKLKAGLITRDKALAVEDKSTTVCGFRTGIVHSPSAPAPGHVGGSVASGSRSIAWSGNWAQGCDFRDSSSSSNFQTHHGVPRHRCLPMCDEDAYCTHFTWTARDGGTCWMKRGQVAASDALATGDASMICGITCGSSRALRPSLVAVLWVLAVRNVCLWL